MNNYKSGKFSEFIARMYMRMLGFNIIYKNFYIGKGTHAGEIDFIAKRGKQIVFVEVKKRKTLSEASYSISKKQQERIAMGAKIFLRRNPQYNFCELRFDAILISDYGRIKHIKNAWSLTA